VTRVTIWLIAVNSAKLPELVRATAMARSCGKN